MKKLFILFALMFVALPVMALDMGGQLDLNFFMNTYNDDTAGAPDEPDNYFGSISNKLWMKADVDGITAFVKLDLSELKSMGMDSGFLTAGPGGLALVQIEEMNVAKDAPFGVEGLSIKFGKMEVPFNLDIDNSITHSMTNRSGGAYASGVESVGEIDFTWGLTGTYDIGEGNGKVSLSLIEAAGGETGGADDDDYDSCMFQSFVLSWDTGKGVDAFGVAGLRVCVGYANLADPDTAGEANTEISIGATYSLADMGLSFGLEMIMGSWADYMASGNTEDVQVISIDVDYAKDQFGVGLTYEMATWTEADSVDNRMSVRGSYNLNDNAKLRFEYASTSNSEIDTAGGTQIILGTLVTF